MGLSDHERKVLAEMEAALEQEDPKLLSTLTFIEIVFAQYPAFLIRSVAFSHNLKYSRRISSGSSISLANVSAALILFSGSSVITSR